MDESVVAPMTGRQRILTALEGGRTDVRPVAIDYMNLYLAERIEQAYVRAYAERLERQGRVQLDPEKDTAIRARSIRDAYQCFEEQHDWLQAMGGPTEEAVSDRELLREEGRFFEVDQAAGTRRELLLTGEEAKTEEMRDRFSEMERRFRWLRSDGQQAASEIVAQYRRQRDRERGNFALVEALIRQARPQQFVYLGIPAPFCSLYGLIGFDGMMTALIEAPSLVCTMMDGLLNATLEEIEAFRDAGGEGVRVEEYFASADIISPQMYERFALPYEERLLSGVREMGLKSVLYFCGDVLPRLPALRELPMDALMVEESKKDFVVEIGEVRDCVGPDLCLFGNVDSYSMVQKGTEAELAAEIDRQIRTAGSEGGFIVGVGSPLTLDTPCSRVDTLIRLARDHPG